jgi:thiazole synthase
MATAFRHAVQAGRTGYGAGLMPTSDVAVATTPVGGQPFVLL